MSILRAVERAYRVMKERGWDTVYWAIDLHGTVIESNYETGSYSYISEQVKEALIFISNRPESKIILWSSMHPADQIGVTEMFRGDGIKVDAFNRNPWEQNSATGCFDDKFYFSILVDDKAGFVPEEWPDVARVVRMYTFKETNNGQN